MDENIKESWEVLLKDINNLLNQFDRLANKEERVEFCKLNEDKIMEFKNNLDNMANKYLIKENNNSEQNKISELLKKVLINWLDNEDIFDTPKEYQSYKSNILDLLAHYENRLIFRLRHSKEISIIFECLEYQKDREDYIKVIKDNQYFKNNYFSERAVRNYINDSYERIMFENVIRIIKDDTISISKRDTKKLIKQIDSIKFIEKILTKEEPKLQAIEKWMRQKYASTIIPLKVSVLPESLENDKLVQAFFDGKIKNEELYMQIANAIPIDEFESLIFAINLKSSNRIIREIKLGNLTEKEKQTINELLEKAGIKIYGKDEKIESDENYLVNIEDLKEYYEEIKIEEMYSEKAKLYKANINENKQKIDSSARKTYAEISIIIKMMTKNMRSRISPKFIEFIERNKNRKNTTDIDRNKKLKNQKLREETKAMLALIYRDYLCTEDERKKLIKAERMKMATKETESNDNNYEQHLVVIQELKWYQRIVEMIKKIIKIKN